MRALVVARPHGDGRGYGVERYAKELCAALTLAGIDIGFLGDWGVARWFARRLPPYGPKISAVVYELLLPFLFVASRGGRADIIHLVDVSFSPSSLLLAKLMKRGTVVTVQSLHRIAYIMPKTLAEPVTDKLYSVYQNLGMKLALKHASVIVAPSTLEEAEMSRFFGNVNVVTVNSSTGIASERGHSPSTRWLTLGCVGALVHWKRLHRAILVLSRLEKEYEECRLLICGEGVLKNELSNYARALGLGSKVEFVGHLTDGLEGFYARLDCLVFSSLRESFGYPILEASNCGVPSISFSDSALAPEVRGLTISVSGVDEAARTILALWRDERRYVQVSKDVTTKARAFSRDSAARNLARVYSQVLRRREPRR